MLPYLIFVNKNSKMRLVVSGVRPGLSIKILGHDLKRKHFRGAEGRQRKAPRPLGDQVFGFKIRNRGTAPEPSQALM